MKVARLLMVLSSLSPLIVLWAIRGTTLVSQRAFLITCGVFVVLPNWFLWLRFRSARALKDQRSLAVGHADDHRDHILVYLFAIMLPFYSEDLATWRQMTSSIAALGFIAFLFWHLNLHYMNIVFAAMGYRVFTIYSPDGTNAVSGKGSFALITRRPAVRPGERIVAYRLSDSVFFEDGDAVGL